LWYARDKEQARFRSSYTEKDLFAAISVGYDWIEQPDGTRRPLTTQDRGQIEDLIAQGYRVCALDNLASQSGGATTQFEYEFGGRKFRPATGGWKTNLEGMRKLESERRLAIKGNRLRYVRYFDDFTVTPVSDVWTDTVIGGFVSEEKVYVVQTSTKVVQRCMLMTTDPGDLVMDTTCGSGTTAVVAEQWGRRWITCDTSRVAITLAKQRLMTSVFDYYELAHPEEGVGSGFRYKTVPHITLRSIANDEQAKPETLYDQPYPDNSKTRVTGPLTVEAVPAPMVKPIDEVEGKPMEKADESVARSGETLRQSEWRAELLRAGIRGKNGQMILFSRVEPMPGTRWLHADAETKPNDHGGPKVQETPVQRVVLSFGPEYAPLEQKQVELAIDEARSLVPKPKVVVFAAFQFDPEAAKDIDETNWPGITLLKVQMNADLLTEDLKKKRASNESFWLIGQPDVELRQIKRGDQQGFWQVEVRGFDYYNTKSGQIESGGSERVAMWMLDPDYDGRSLFPRQVFFPMAGDTEGWARLAKNLKAEIDDELIEHYRGTLSLPFEIGPHKRVAVKIIDDRGIESLRVLQLESGTLA
jgi:adenine-specific DNA-methyltransferase